MTCLIHHFFGNWFRTGNDSIIVCYHIGKLNLSQLYAALDRIMGGPGSGTILTRPLTDFERGFICAETITCDDFVACGGEQGARDAGKMRQEGKDYVVEDGDILLVRFNV